MSFQYFFKIDKKSHQAGSQHDPAKMLTIPKEVNVQHATEISIDQEQESNNKKDFSACTHKREGIVAQYKYTPLFK